MYLRRPQRLSPQISFSTSNSTIPPSAGSSIAFIQASKVPGPEAASALG